MSEVFVIEGRRALVEGIPAWHCDDCGESLFAPDTVERVRALVRSNGAKVRTEPLDVFALG